MADEIYYDGQGRRQTRKTTSGGDVADAKAAERLGSTAGSGLGAKGNAGKSPMPKQADFPTMASYMTALREWRSKDADASARVKALQ